MLLAKKNLALLGFMLIALSNIAAAVPINSTLKSKSMIIDNQTPCNITLTLNNNPAVVIAPGTQSSTFWVDVKGTFNLEFSNTQSHPHPAYSCVNDWGVIHEWTFTLSTNKIPSDTEGSAAKIWLSVPGMPHIFPLIAGETFPLTYTAYTVKIIWHPNQK